MNDAIRTAGQVPEQAAVVNAVELPYTPLQKQQLEIDNSRLQRTQGTGRCKRWSSGQANRPNNLKRRFR